MFVRAVNDDVSLALIQQSFAEEYYAIVDAQRPYLSQWLSWPEKGRDVEFFSAFVTHALQEYAHGRSLVCAMLYRGTLVGNVSFNNIDHSLKKVLIGYWLREDYQGKGIVTSAVQKMIAIAFDEMGMTKACIAAAVDNQPSRAVAERLGFVLEGVVTQAENLNGRIVDHALYGLHRPE